MFLTSRTARMETFLLIFWLVPKNLNPSFSCGYCEYALKILDKDMLKLCYSLMLFPLMILLDLKKIINSLESSTPKKNLYFYRLVVIIGVLFRKYLLFLTNVKQLIFFLTKELLFLTKVCLCLTELNVQVRNRLMSNFPKYLILQADGGFICT